MVRMATDRFGSDTDRLPKVFAEPGIERRRRYIERLGVGRTSNSEGDRLRLRIECRAQAMDCGGSLPIDVIPVWRGFVRIIRFA
jgi:hypothetical protein